MSTMTKSVIHWTLLTHEDWNMYIAATSDGLCYIGSQNQAFEELSYWAASGTRNYSLIQDDYILYPYESELIEYLIGKRKSFTLPFDYQGTPFQMSVWRALCNIPYGQIQTYSDIAAQINKPAAVRAVGSAIGANPLLIIIPCHRVIGKNGALTGYRGGMEMKTKLLQLEQDGIVT